ncbi:Phospholipase A and acyltransferase 2 [Bulinus truncatus]|nr:Phospholipase A and acyltransferase 2 [Bulinus truncatus]
MAGASINHQHNKHLYDRLKVGDRVEFKRGYYSHWGIYIGFGKIAHLAGEDDDGIDANMDSIHLFSIGGTSFNKAQIRIDDFWTVVGGDKAYINNSRDKTWKALDPDTIVSNATQRIGHVGYNLIYSNCEHFTNWCRYGMSKSDQVESVITGIAVAATGILAAGLTYALAKWGKKEETDEKNKQPQ